MLQMNSLRIEDSWQSMFRFRQGKEGTQWCHRLAVLHRNNNEPSTETSYDDYHENSTIPCCAARAGSRHCGRQEKYEEESSPKKSCGPFYPILNTLVYARVCASAGEGL